MAILTENQQKSPFFTYFTTIFLPYERENHFYRAFLLDQSSGDPIEWLYAFPRLSTEIYPLKTEVE